METWIETEPAYHEVPKHGVHGLTLGFLLRGDKGAVQFVLYTNWMLPETYEWWSETGKAARHLNEYGEYESCPLPADLGFHSYKPMYGEQEPLTDSCHILHNKPCYYGGSTLNAKEPFQVLVREGLEGLWKYLEGYYNEVFEEER